ncbi:hypothetical protein Rruber_03717 [Rhodococcus ruber]
MVRSIDWSERHYEVAVVDQDKNLVAKRRIDGADGFADLLTMRTDLSDLERDPVPVEIETPLGPLVAALRATGRAVCDQPDDGGTLSETLKSGRSKSDHADAPSERGSRTADA